MGQSVCGGRIRLWKSLNFYQKCFISFRKFIDSCQKCLVFCWKFMDFCGEFLVILTDFRCLRLYWNGSGSPWIAVATDSD